MGFFDTLRKVLGNEPKPDVVPADGATFDRAWGPETPADADGPASAQAGPGLYDRAQWVKKVGRVLEGLPATRPEWAVVEADARALGLEPEFVLKTQTDAFLMMMRKAVSDRTFTESEHRTLDLARDLIGVPEAEAEAALHAVVGEAEAFFKRPVEGA